MGRERPDADVGLAMPPLVYHIHVQVQVYSKMTRIISALASLSLSFMAFADEGMWTIDNFPVDSVAEKYDIDIGDDWLRKAQLATTRLENGCTGSFASESGLVLTNNHCTWGCIRNLSTAVLVDFEEVSDKVASATAGMDEADANEARKAELTRLESACEAASDDERSCEAVTLYNGGQYFIYEYKRYDDVRLVFAPGGSTRTASRHKRPITCAGALEDLVRTTRSSSQDTRVRPTACLRLPSLSCSAMSCCPCGC